MKELIDSPPQEGQIRIIKITFAILIFSIPLKNTLYQFAIVAFLLASFFVFRANGCGQEFKNKTKSLLLPVGLILASLALSNALGLKPAENWDMYGKFVYRYHP